MKLGGNKMYRIKPYNRSVFDVMDVFDDFFNERQYKGSLKIDVRDLEKEYIVDVDVPGLSKEDIEIHFENERLIISVTKEEEKNDEADNYVHKERYFVSSKRSVYLKDVDPKQFKATLTNGVLTIKASKLEEKISKYLIDIE